MIRPIILWPDERLSTPCIPFCGDPARRTQALAGAPSGIHALVNDLFETMAAADGLGLSAPQIGVLSRVLVIDTPPDLSIIPRTRGAAQRVAMVDPVIIASDLYRSRSEGCLSIPGQFEAVVRHDQVEVEWVDYKLIDAPVSLFGDYKIRRCFYGLAARAILHEIDHLDGRMFPDLLSHAKRTKMRTLALAKRPAKEPDHG